MYELLRSLTIMAILSLSIGYLHAQGSPTIRAYIASETPELEPLLANFVEEVETVLRSNGYALEEVADPADAQISLVAKPENYAGQTLRVEVLSFAGELPSPILYEDYGEAVLFPLLPADHERLNLVSETVAGAALYSIGACEAAIEFLSHVADELLYYSGEVYGFAQLYIGTCYLAQENYEAAVSPLRAAFYDAFFGDIRTNNAIAINHAWLLITHTDLYYDDESEIVEGTYADEPIQVLRHIACARPSRFRCSDEQVLDVLPRRAQLYALGFDYTSALADMDRVITLAAEMGVEESKFAELYTLRGEIVLLTYEWDAALADFNTALEFDPTYAPAYFERGILYYTRAQREEALADFNTYLALAPDGENAELAQEYIASIEIELEALGG